MDKLQLQRLLAEARTAAANDFYKKSFDLYLSILEKHPRKKEQLEYEFHSVLVRLNETLDITDDRGDIFTNLKRAIHFYPESVSLLNVIGKYFWKYEYYNEALCYFEKAFDIDNSKVNVEKNLNNVRKILFPSYYFKTINDKKLNDAYREALKESVNENSDSVLDVNVGPGILTLYANDCCPLSTVACDDSPTMVQLAKRVLRENSVRESIVTNMPSTSLDQSLMNGKKTLLVTNMFEAGLFGDYLLDTLNDAWTNLLYEGDRVLPKRAEYFIIGVNCNQLQCKYQLRKHIRKFLNIPTIHVHTSTYYGTPYHEQEINLYKDLKYVTEAVPLLKINFNDGFDISDKLDPKTEQFDYTIDIKVTEDCEVTNLIGFFNLFLTDDVMVTTDPRSQDRIEAWHQAVFYDFLPGKYTKGEVLQKSFSSYGGVLELIEPDLVKSRFGYRISRAMLTFLNDQQYIKGIMNSVPIICLYVGQIVDISDTEIVDLCPFPIFGLEMLKRGAKHLTCNPSNSDDQTFIEIVLKMNNIPLDKVKILLGDRWTNTDFKDNMYHVIFNNILDLNGDIDVQKRRLALYLQHAHLVDDGLFLPHKMTIMGQLVNCKRLDVQNRVYDENVGYKIAAHVNRYQVSQVSNLNLTLLDYEALSDTIVISPDCYRVKSDVVKAPVTNDGECNAILCWYEMQLLDESEVISTNRTDSFVENSAFLVHSPISLLKGGLTDIISCVDLDGSFKLILDREI